MRRTRTKASQGSQPPTKKRRKASSSSQEEEEANEPRTQIPAGQRAISLLDPTVSELLVGQVVRLVLFKHSNQLPVTRAEILKEIKKKVVGKNLTTGIIELARNVLRRVFNFHLEELTTKTPNGSKGTGVYILLNRFNKKSIELGELREEICRGTPRETRNRSFLMVVLSMLFMGNAWTMRESNLWQRLDTLGMSPSNSGPVERRPWYQILVQNTFPQQKFIIRTKGGEGIAADDYMISIGPRAIKQIGKLNILNHVSHVLGEDVDLIRRQEILDEIKDEGSQASEEEEEESEEGSSSEESGSEESGSEESESGSEESESDSEESSEVDIEQKVKVRVKEEKNPKRKTNRAKATKGKAARGSGRG
eukprot:TRINITY_DN323_c0_g1_i1.p1 TRINITY_DN323_c0_g1~~TRINITY_DN323_c0_g1_i1.p1  ORF type:complete len:365 (+),score=82.66 TRINITY_DN323_c0_g1_i1:80-1174(+)